MEFETIARVIAETGVMAAVMALLVVVVGAVIAMTYKLWTFIDTFLGNHMHHIEKDVASMAKHMKKMGDSLENLNDIADKHWKK